jgi:hypothetical protein
MKVAFWIVAGLLAVFYLYAGGKKVVQSRDQLRPSSRPAARWSTSAAARRT